MWYRDGLPALSCGRMRLREVHPDDAPTLNVLFARPEVSVHLSPPPATVEAFLDWIHLFRAKRVEGQATAYALTEEDDVPVGIFMSYRSTATDETAEIGFAMSPHFWGTGVFGPTAMVFVDFLFANWNVKALIGRTLVRNHRALGAMRKLGAIIVEHSMRDGKPELVWTVKREEVYPSRR
ncbi:MAG: GNAT family N-acetyltransferase [Vicinamibacterales bacterium]